MDQFATEIRKRLEEEKESTFNSCLIGLLKTNFKINYFFLNWLLRIIMYRICHLAGAIDDKMPLDHTKILGFCKQLLRI